jgi:GTP-binding protein
VYLVANKADNTERIQMASEFYELGMGDPYPISSQTGSGTGDLLDEVIKHFKEEDPEDPDAGVPRISILGRPNVGKSSFLNVLLGEERSIVTDIAGTTRDSINSRYKLFGQDFIITDTAGVRRKAKIKDDIEFYSILRTIRTLEESDVCIVMLDATRGIEAQDVNIIALAERRRKGIVIMVNKWDLIEKETNTAKQFKEEILKRIAPIDYVPVLFTSVPDKQRIYQTIEAAVKVYKNRSQRVPTSALNDALLPAIEHYPPPSLKGKYVKIKYITQLPTKTPTFAFFLQPAAVHQGALRTVPGKPDPQKLRLRRRTDQYGVPEEIRAPTANKKAGRCAVSTASFSGLLSGPAPAGRRRQIFRGAKELWFACGSPATYAW